jgi:hypothetical protein
MNGVALSTVIKRKAEFVSNMGTSGSVVRGMGFAIPIPEEANEEARKFVDNELADLMWDFRRVRIGRLEYYVLFI